MKPFAYLNELAHGNPWGFALLAGFTAIFIFCLVMDEVSRRRSQ